MALFPLVVAALVAVVSGEAEFDQGLAAEGLGTPEGAIAARRHFEAASRLGYLNAYQYLGRMVENGQGGPADHAEAMRLYERGADQGDHEAIEDLIRIYEARQDPTRTLVWLDRLAQAGDPEALPKLMAFFQHVDRVQVPAGFETHLDETEDATGQAELIKGLALMHGTDVPQAYPRALALFKQAASHGCAPAFAAVGDMFALGLGVPVSYWQAGDFYRNGASRDDRASQLGLGWLQATGRRDAGYTSLPGDVWERTAQGDTVALYSARLAIVRDNPRGAVGFLVPRRELPEARRLLGGFLVSGTDTLAYRPGAFAALEARARAGDAKAGFEVAEHLRRGAPGDGEGNRCRYQAAWLRPAAQAGDARAQLALARCIDDDLGVPKPEGLGTAGEALDWLQRAAGQGLMEAELALAKRLAGSNPSAAFRWGLAAAEHGDAEAQRLTVHAYLHGLGVPASVDAAERLAVRKKNAYAALEVAEVLDTGTLGAPDVPRALRLLRFAAGDENCWAAQALLAAWIERGHGVAADPISALALYRRVPTDNNVAFELHLADLYRRVMRDEARADYWLASALADEQVQHEVAFQSPASVPAVANKAALILSVAQRYVAGVYRGDPLVSPYGPLNAIHYFRATHPIEVLKSDFVRAQIDLKGDPDIVPDPEWAGGNFSDGADAVLEPRIRHLAPLRQGLPHPRYLARVAAAARRGDPDARFDHAWLLANGTGVPQDHARAIALLRANRHDFASRLLLAQLLVKNRRTVAEGIAIFQAETPRVLAAPDPRRLVAAQRGPVVSAPAVAGRGKAELARADAALGFEERLAWLRRAAEVGSTQAMLTLAKLAEDGRCMPADDVERLTWLTLARASGADVDLDWAVKRARYPQVVAAQARAAAWWATHSWQGRPAL